MDAETGYKSVFREVTSQENDGPVAGLSNYVLNRLFVAGFDEQTTERELRAFFENLGKVKTVNIIADRVERPYGFVTFENKTDCIKILKRKNEFEFHIRGKTLQINPAWFKPARTIGADGKYKNKATPAFFVSAEKELIASNGDRVLCTTLNGTTFFKEIPTPFCSNQHVHANYINMGICGIPVPINNGETFNNMVLQPNVQGEVMQYFPNYTVSPAQHYKNNPITPTSLFPNPTAQQNKMFTYTCVVPEYLNQATATVFSNLEDQTYGPNANHSVMKVNLDSSHDVVMPTMHAVGNAMCFNGMIPPGALPQF